VRQNKPGSRARSLLGADRSISPVIGTVLMVGIVVVLAAFVSIAVFGIADEPGEQAPTVSLDTEFRAVSEVDPHWQLEVIHDGGDPVPSDELLVRFVDDSGSQAEVRYPERFDAGERFRTALWGKSGRADTSTCLVDPESDHPDSDQLDGFKTADEFATSVDVLVIHEPSNTVLSEERIDLGEEPDRFTGKKRHYLVDGVVPSIGCSEVDESNW
jgi:flagellin-like protein